MALDPTRPLFPVPPGTTREDLRTRREGPRPQRRGQGQGRRRPPGEDPSGEAYEEDPAPPPTPEEMERFRARVYRLVALIPHGRVATYGQIAALAGHPRRSRHVGQALGMPHDPALPWHRVLNAQGKVSARAGESPHTAGTRGEPVERRQQRLLEAEGVVFTGGKVNLARYRWRPEEAGGAFAAEMAQDATDEEPSRR